MKANDLRDKLRDKGLKVTPQRMAVLETISSLKNHPTAENIIEQVRKRHPNIATGTVYKVLDALVENNLVRKVNTEKDVMRYDAVMASHHHLYCSESDRIEDYFDNELNDMIIKYFNNKKIQGFNIEDIKLHITGKFTDLKQ